jgi:para-nitrobenzyl esterase
MAARSISSTLLAIALAFASALLAAAEPVQRRSPIVQTTSGAVAGLAGDVTVFKGIPFAAPPVGPLRWREPQPPAPWSGVRPATHFGHDCMQTPYVISTGQAASEDCLTLNVWTPSPRASAKAPVMVFIYGGAFIGGSGAYPLYDGAALARQGVVVVNFNYRVGVFGFLAHPQLTAQSPHHTSGDYGLLDQIAALQWVKANIGAFGGDPAKVTILGESAGASSIAMLMTSPLAKGLFQRAIMQSTALSSDMPDLATAEAAGLKLGANIQTLRATPADKLLAATFSFAPHRSGIAGLPFPTPVVDGYVLPRQPAKAFARGEFANVPTLIGENAVEGRMFAPKPKDATLKAYHAWAAKTFGDLAPAFLKLYPAATDSEALAAMTAAYGDGEFGYATRLIARAVSRRQPHTYSYLFTYVQSGPEFDEPPPTHSQELPFVFDTLNQPAFIAHPPPDESDRAMSQTMMAAWVRFAAKGDPNGPGLPAWPTYDAESDPYLEFGLPLKIGHAFHKPEIDLMQEVHETR